MQEQCEANRGRGAAQASAGAQGAVDQAQQMVDQVTNQAQQTTGQVAEQVKQQAAAHVSSRIDQAADGLGSVTQALQAVSGQLRQQEQPLLAECADRVAEQVQRAAGYLQGKNLDQLVNDVEQFARQQPAVFVAGAFTLGLLAARFLKSSGAATPPDQLMLPSSQATERGNVPSGVA